MTKPGDLKITYKIPVGDAEYRLTERGSRFIGYCAPTADDKTAVEIIEQRSRRHHDATHHCWAYRVGDPIVPTERSSDAGEPSGTAGRPILEQLCKANLIGAVLVVSRWFGGTKLGRGGLMRAYGSCAAETIARLETRIERPVATLVVECGYDIIGLVERTAGKFEGKVEGGDYGETVRLKVCLPVSSEEEFKQQLSEAGAGKVRFFISSLAPRGRSRER